MEIMIRYFVFAVILQSSITPALAQYANGGSHANLNSLLPEQVRNPTSPLPETVLNSISLFPKDVVQSTESFAHAVGESSTSFHYVRIRVNEGAGQSGLLSCTSGGNLNLAIRREYGLPANREGIARATSIAVANPDRTFLFKNPNALAAVMPTFSETDLVEVRNSLAALSSYELRRGFRVKPWGKLHAQFRDERKRDAAACVLIEHGLSPGISDRSGSIYLDD